MDIWQKINPFHPRPPSSQRPHTPFTITEDAHSSQHTSSIDFDHPAQPSRQYSYRDVLADSSYVVHTPLPPSPTKTHKSNPSILRSLAHHPSLSALKSRSKTKRKSKNPPPPLPDFGVIDQRLAKTHDEDGNRAEERCASPRKLRKGEGSGMGMWLKGSRSVPRGLRLSGEYGGPADRYSTQAVHHLALPPSNLPPKQLQTLFSTTPIRRNPAPTPEITIEHEGFGFNTPESVRIRRLRFEIELRHESLGGSDSPRRRGMSCDDSPGRGGGLGNGLSSTRHLSSPPPSSPSRTPPPPLRTQQHPHPIPRSASTYEGNSTSYYYTPGDFQSLTESGRTIEGVELDVGLDLLVGDEELPSGTPGGKKDDLRKAVRVFSRDTYARLTSPSPTPSPVPSPTPQIVNTSTSRQDKRSSSPFEVKLSACVTKRMSLDAFGTPTEEGCISEAAMEELLEDFDSELSEEDEDAERVDKEKDGDLVFQHTSLSTILESTSTSTRAGEARKIEPGSSPRPGYHTSTPVPGCTTPDKTPYYTANSLDLSSSYFLSLGSNGMPISTFAPRAVLERRHASAPPLALTQRLLEANVEHARRLRDEIEKSEDVRKILAREVEEKEEAIEELRARLILQNSEHRAGVQELRTALSENEELCETLQQAHDALAMRCTDLETERGDLLHLRSEDAQTVVEAQHALTVAEERVKDMRVREGKAEVVITGLRSAMALAEGKMEIREQEHAECVASQGLQVEGLVKRAEEAEGRVESLEVGRRCLQEELGEKDAALRQMTATHKEGLVQLSALDAALRSETVMMMEKDENIAQLDLRLREMEVAQLVDQSQTTVDTAQVQTLERTISGLEAGLQAKELIVASLSAENDKIRNQSYTKIRQSEGAARDVAFKLSTLGIRFSEVEAQLDEKTRELSALTAEAELRKATGEKSLATSASDLKNALRQLNAKESIINVLREKVRTVGFAGDEKIAMAQAEGEGFRREIERLSRRCAEAEDGLKDGAEGLARLEEERRRWEEERSELIQMITRAGNSQDSASILRDELDQTQHDLDMAQQNVEYLSVELDDARNALVTRKSTLGLQDEELAYLRAAMTQAEDAIDAAHCETDRRTKDFQRAMSRLEETIGELQDLIASKDVALQQALMSSEMSKTSSEDGKSRLNAYLGEIDRLSLREAELGKVVDDLRKKSADEEMKRVEMGKRIEGLEMDRDLLNVALNSKQTELILLQRATPTPAPRSTTKNGMARSTSHLFTPTPVSRDSIMTPMPNKRLSMSISSSDISNLRSSHARRESMTLATPANVATPKAKPPILGASTRHNRRKSSMGGASGVVRAPVAASAGLGGRRSAVVEVRAGQGQQAGLSRQSSLPVLKGRIIVEGGNGDPERQNRENVEQEEQLA